MGHTTTNTVKPEKEVEVPEKLETIDKFLIIPMVGGIEFATYGFIIFILDIFFNFLPTI